MAMRKRRDADQHQIVKAAHTDANTRDGLEPLTR